MSHECRVLARDDLFVAEAARPPPTRWACDVRAIGTVSIMISAVEIARHLVIPSLESNLFRCLLTING